MNIGYDKPFRCSQLTALMGCLGGGVLQHLATDDSSGAAADTGSAVGRVIELFHRSSADPLRQAQAKGEVEKFPLARWSEVEKMFSHYAADPRNQGVVIPESQEEELEFELTAHESDPLGLPIKLTGHIDQARTTASGQVEIWDVKSGQAEGHEMLPKFVWQQVAYTYGYQLKHPELTVASGGLIRLRGYEVRARIDGKLRARSPGEHPVFFAYGYRWSDIEAIILQIRLAFAQLRRRELLLKPGDHCRYCPGQSYPHCRHELADRGFNV